MLAQLFGLRQVVGQLTSLLILSGRRRARHGIGKLVEECNRVFFACEAARSFTEDAARHLAQQRSTGGPEGDEVPPSEQVRQDE